MTQAADVLSRLAGLPFQDVRAICGSGPLLVLAPHPDDESLGCGGLIALAHEAGIAVHVALLTDGGMSHPNSAAYPRARLAALRAEEMAEALATLGLPPGRLTRLDYRDTAAPRSGRALREAGDRLAALAWGLGAHALLATWRHDPHCDHLAAHRIATRAARQTGLRQLAYPVWGWTLPPGAALPRTALRGARLDIAAVLPRKQAAIACHRSQYAGLITDDPAGFQLPPGLLDVCDRPFETILTLRG